MPLKLLSLNIEANRHLDRVCAAIEKYLPDVVCLQEALEEDCAQLAATGGYSVKFALSTRKLMTTRHGPAGPRDWGLAVLTRIPVRNQTVIGYSADPQIRIYRESNDPRRKLLITELEHEGNPYRIATTHFTWSPDGRATAEQHTDFEQLKPLLAEYGHYVLCGDLNAPRGRPIFARFVDELGLLDHVPTDVSTTIDPVLHRAGALQLVVDAMLSTPHYCVSDVQVLDGLSDHKGIMATVERRARANA